MDRVAAAPEAELARKQTNKRTNAVKYDKLAHAGRLQKANPNFDFKTADPIDAGTSSRRSSKRPKRSHAESTGDEEYSQPQNPADQVNDQPQAEDVTLVNDDPQADDSTEINDLAHALDYEGNGQDQQHVSAGQVDDQAQTLVVETNNHDQHIVYHDGHQAQDAMNPANNGDEQILQQQNQPQYQQQYQEDHAFGQMYDQAQLPPEQANYQTQPNQLAMMQQANSSNHQVPQAS